MVLYANFAMSAFQRLQSDRIQQKGRFYNRFVPMQWHEFFRSKLVVLSIKTVGSILFPAVPFHVNKLVLILFYDCNGVECFNP
jgi:hypothetical protein